MTPASQQRSAIVFAGLFILVGVVAIGIGVWELVRTLRCSHWPTTEGVIQTARKESQEGNKGGRTYSAAFSYTYQVAGIKYEGTRLAYGTRSASSQYANGILSRFPVGKKTPVYYSPNDPQEAVLEMGIHGGTGICFGVGTVFVLAGVMMLAIFKTAFRLTTMPAQGEAMRPANIGLKQPPILMGVIFMVMGSFMFFAEQSSGTPQWILYAAGGMFEAIGVSVLLQRGRYKRYAKIAGGVATAAFVAIMIWLLWVAYLSG